MEVTFHICPACHEQVSEDEYLGASHDHDGVQYDAVEVALALPHEIEGRLEDAAWRARQAAAAEEGRTQAQKDEEQRLVDEWLASAPLILRREYEEYKKQGATSVAGLTNIMKSTFVEPIKHHLWSNNYLAGADAADARPPRFITADEAARRNDQRQEWRDTIAEFEAHGPMGVAAYRVRLAHEGLLRLGPDEELPVGYRPRDTLEVTPQFGVANT